MKPAVQPEFNTKLYLVYESSAGVAEHGCLSVNPRSIRDVFLGHNTSARSGNLQMHNTMLTGHQQP